MLIADLFETKVSQKIEPVIKVGETADEGKLAAEIGSYVVTPTIEKYLADFLDHYTDTFQVDMTEIGVWISGYFGSGKSHLAKVMALLAQNRKLLGVTACERFKARVPLDAPDRDTILRAVARVPQCETQVLAFNINTLADSKTTPLPKLLLSQFYQARGYGSNLLYARVIESELDRQGKLADLHAAVEASAKKPWADIQKNLTFFQTHLYAAACKLAPDAFPTPAAVGDALLTAQAGELHNVGFLVDTLLDDLRTRQKARQRPQRLMLVLDESGQWIEGDRGRLSQMQALIEEAAIKGQGKIWIVVTTHGDMGSILKEARALEGDMKKIESRFRYKFSLTTENIGLVLEDRLLRKNHDGFDELRKLYAERGVVRDLGEIKTTEHILPDCLVDQFVTYYPFFPYQIHLVPDIVKSLRSKGGRGEQLSGSTRTLLAIAQDVLRAGRRKYLEEGVGELVSFDEVYGNLAGEGEVSPDVRDDIARIPQTVPGATALTRQVAEVLYLVREIKYFLRTKDNIARLLVQNVDDDVASLVHRIEPELARLRAAKPPMVAAIGDEYEFLSGEKRTFEEEVATREGEMRVQDLERGLAEHFFHHGGKTHWTDWLKFDTVPYHGTEFRFKLVLDGVAMPGGKGDVTLRFCTPLGRDSRTSMESRSLGQDEKASLFVLSAQVPGFQENLARYLAMREIIDIWKGNNAKSEAARNLALDREANDLPKVKAKILEGFREGIAHSCVIFRGGSRNLAVPQGKTPAEALRGDLATFWPVIYPKYDKVPVKVGNEEAAIRDVLAGRTENKDVLTLKLYDSAGKLDSSAPLLDAIRVFMAGQATRDARVLGADLLAEFTRPPYGWDGAAVRVGLAAFVRGAMVKVTVGKKTYTNPSDPDLVDAIRVTSTYNKAEFTLEETEVDPDTLAAVRVFLRKLTKRRDIDETPAALSEAAGQLANEIAARVEKLTLWASGAGFPLPASFTEGVDVWVKIPTIGNPVHRVNEVHLDQTSLEAGKTAIDLHVAFRTSDGTIFVEMTGRYQQLQAVEEHFEAAAPVKAFLAGYEATLVKAGFADKETWKLLRSQDENAQIELGAAMERWRDEARTNVQGALDALPDRLTSLGLAPDSADDLKEPLESFLAGLDEVVVPVKASNLPKRAARLIRTLDEALARKVVPPKPPEPPRPPEPPKEGGEGPRPPTPRVREIRRVRFVDLVPRTVIHDEGAWLRMRAEIDRIVREILARGQDVEFE